MSSRFYEHTPRSSRVRLKQNRAFSVRSANRRRPGRGSPTDAPRARNSVFDRHGVLARRCCRVPSSPPPDVETFYITRVLQAINVCWESKEKKPHTTSALRVLCLLNFNSGYYANTPCYYIHPTSSSSIYSTVLARARRGWVKSSRKQR